MKSGKIILVVLIVLSSVIGASTFYEPSSKENNHLQIIDFSSHKNTVKIELSDGTSSSDTG
jgi:hypothetical protein